MNNTLPTMSAAPLQRLIWIGNISTSSLDKAPRQVNTRQNDKKRSSSPGSKDLAPQVSQLTLPILPIRSVNQSVLSGPLVIAQG
jgi:hypothetical protein